MHENYKHPDTFGLWLGYKIVEFQPDSGKATVVLKIRDDHLSPAGRVHGGVISSLLDYACGAAVFTKLGKSEFSATVELKINYLRPVHREDELKALTELVFRGKRLAVCHGRLYRNEEPEPVAMVTATFNIVSK
jgi:uncharacterized protein (TIGR00369 family)